MAHESQAASELAFQFLELGDHINAGVAPAEALDRLVSLAQQFVPGADWVSVTQGGSARRCLAATDDIARTADRVQTETNEGPCLQAAEEHTVVVSQDVSAWLVGARLGTSVAPTTRASVAVGVDALSGDATPGDGRYGAFATMYATNHPFYGVMDVIGDPATTTRDRGLADVLATASAELTTRTSLRAEAHRFTMMTGADRSLGWETDLGLPVRISHAATIELGYSVFRASTGAAAVGLGDRGQTKNWAYAQFGVAF